MASNGKTIILSGTTAITIPLALLAAVALFVFGLGRDTSKIETKINANALAVQSNAASIEKNADAIKKMIEDLPDRIGKSLSSAFTDVSNSRGMYALEGRPRLDKLELEAASLRLRNQELSIRVRTLETAASIKPGDDDGGK